MAFQPKKIAPDTWLLTPDAAAYLICGQDRALLLDTGHGDVDIPAAVKSLTDLPVLLANTHYHGDHTAYNRAFGTVYAHPAEIPQLKGTADHFIPVEAGYVFDLGGRQLEVLHTPGHTPGSIALLDRANRCLFSGDVVADVPIFMHKEDCSLPDYIATLDKLAALLPMYDTICNCHGTIPIAYAYVAKLKACALKVLDGTVPSEPAMLPIPGTQIPVLLCSWDGASMFRPLPE